MWISLEFVGSKDLRLPFLSTVFFCILWITLWTLWIILKIHGFTNVLLVDSLLHF